MRSVLFFFLTLGLITSVQPAFSYIPSGESLFKKIPLRSDNEGSVIKVVSKITLNENGNSAPFYETMYFKTPDTMLFQYYTEKEGNEAFSYLRKGKERFFFKEGEFFRIEPNEVPPSLFFFLESKRGNLLRWAREKHLLHLQVRKIASDAMPSLGEKQKLTLNLREIIKEDLPSTWLDSLACLSHFLSNRGFQAGKCALSQNVRTTSLQVAKQSGALDNYYLDSLEESLWDSDIQLAKCHAAFCFILDSRINEEVTRSLWIEKETGRIARYLNKTGDQKEEIHFMYGKSGKGFPVKTTFYLKKETPHAVIETETIDWQAKIPAKSIHLLDKIDSQSDLESENGHLPKSSMAQFIKSFR